MAEPSYSLEDKLAMRRKEEEEKIAARKQALLSSSYKQIDIPRDLGLDCGQYKWKQNQSYVEIFIPLPSHVDSASKISVELKPDHISVVIDEKPFLCGTLFRQVKAEESTWYIQDGLLEIILLKRSRRGQYAAGETNANTYWKSVTRKAPEKETLQLENPPSQYYHSPFEGEEKRLKAARRAIKSA